MAIRDATFTALKAESCEVQLHAESIDSAQVFVVSHHAGCESIYCNMVQGRDWPALCYLTRAGKTESDVGQEQIELLQDVGVHLAHHHVSSESILFYNEGYVTHGLTTTIVRRQSFWVFFLRWLASRK
jgi:hypothetical protein